MTIFRGIRRGTSGSQRTPLAARFLNPVDGPSARHRPLASLLPQIKPLLFPSVVPMGWLIDNLARRDTKDIKKYKSGIKKICLKCLMKQVCLSKQLNLERKKNRKKILSQQNLVLKF